MQKRFLEASARLPPNQKKPEKEEEHSVSISRPCRSYVRHIQLIVGGKSMRTTTIRKTTKTAALLLMSSVPMLAAAHAPSGAIFTTVADGSEVNFNIYGAKEDVYLDGGPGPGAPQTAAGLDDGTYVFQVTEPSGRTLLSTDPAQCRQFIVSGGIITSVAPSGECAHVTGVDIDHGAVTVQLMPYLDTPNPGGVYKVWIVEVGDFLADCAELGVPNGLAVVNCGRAPGNQHGFVPRHTKTDNFKVGTTNNLEIDTQFFNENGGLLDGRSVTWTDTLGSSNVKHSYSNAQIGVLHMAHVEAVEAGVHTITVADQPGCKVTKFFNESVEIWGPGAINVTVKHNDRVWTKYLTVYCDTQ